MIPAGDISVFRRKNLQTAKKKLTKRTGFFGKHEIIHTPNLSFLAERPSPPKNHTFFIIERYL
ncbi:MAG: hypothetical protein PVF66_07350 [Candidatus Aminicenantes bacterium]|jgi:hypothetical protein